MLLSGILIFCSLLQLAFAVPLEYLYTTCEHLDLTYEFNSDTIYWPTVDSFKRDVIFNGTTDKGFYYSSFKFCAAEHGGTHLDAPFHFSENGQSVEQIPVKTFMGEALVIDVSDKVKANRDYSVSSADIENYVKNNGKIHDHAILIIHTGYGVYWPSKKEYLGSDVPKDDKNLHFPGVSKEAATWLANNTNVKVLGIDTASMDPGPSQDFPVHRLLLAKNISFIENLRNVDKLPPRGATILAMPMYITGGSGAPMRVVAVGWKGSSDPCRITAASSSLRPIMSQPIIILFTSFALVRQLRYD